MRVRDAFFSRITNETRNGKDIVIVSSDIGAPSLDDFRRDFPHRFVNVGIAEQNAIAVASGLQTVGKTVVTYGLNPFSVTRSFDQIRNLLASLQIPVTVTALNAGTCSADAGYSHMAIENISIMRTLKHIKIVNPTDETIIDKLVDEIINNPCPRYIQFDKYLDGKIYRREDIDFSRGFVSNGVDSETAVISYGIKAFELMKMEEAGHLKLIDCFSLPVDEDMLVDEISTCKRVYTIEDGVSVGGIGSMILEVLNDHKVRIPVIRKALSFMSGYPNEYTNRNRIWNDEKMLVRHVLEEIGRK